MEASEQKLDWGEIVSSRVAAAGPGSDVKVVPLAPKPRYTPAPVEKPPEMSAGAIENCKKKIAARGFPNGFKSKEEFEECLAELCSLIEASGIPVKAAGVRGMAASYKSLNPGRVGHHFDKNGPRTSDVDAFFMTEARLKLGARPSAAGVFQPADVAAAFPEVAGWSERWTERLGRPVTAAAFTSLESLKELYVPCVLPQRAPAQGVTL